MNGHIPQRDRIAAALASGAKHRAVAEAAKLPKRQSTTIMSMLSNSQRRWAVAAVVCAGLLASFGVREFMQWRDARLFETPFRIGFYNTAVEHFPASDGSPAGNTVDLLNEAARRAGIKLEWVYSPEGTDAALESGKVDLWPGVGDLPERRGHLYISAPWNMSEFGLVSRASDPIASESSAGGITLAVFPGTTEDKLTRRKFPNGKFLAVGNASEQLSAVCTGKAQASVVTQNFNQLTLPAECLNVALQMVDAPGFSVRFGVGASYLRPGAVKAANALRDELGKMDRDGSLVGTEFRWLDPSLPQTRALFYLLSAEHSERLLAEGAILLGAVLVLLMWFIIARRRAANALAEERRLLRTLIDNMPDYIYVKDAKSRFVLANRAVAELTGAKSPEEMLGKTDFDYFPKEIAAAFFSDDQAIVRSGQPLLNREERSVDAHGSAKWNSTSKVPWRDKTGQVVGIMGIGRDVTAHKRAEEALAEERRLLRTLIDTMPDRIYVKDAGSRWVVANRALAELVGAKSPRELIGKTDFDYFPEEIAKAFFTDEQAILQSGKALVDQVEERVDDQGITTWTSTTKVPWRDKLGHVVGVMGIGRDITEHKSAEEKFHKAFNASPEPITISTVLEGRYVDVNESFLRTTGYRREEVIGRTSLELKFWETPEDRMRLIEHLEEHGSVRDMEIPFRVKSGEQRIGLHSVGRIKLGGQDCIIYSQKDITEQKSMEKQYRQAQKMEAVGRLSGGIAHDFNNLLGVIIGYSEMLEENLGENQRLQKVVGEIKKAGQRAATLTRQLLAFSRQQVLEAKVLNLNDIVADTEKMLQRLIGEDIELTTDLATDLGQVRADHGQMEQVILNLVVNARDAMPDGGRLTIETRNVELDEDYCKHHPPSIPGRYVALMVTDTGIGMDAGTQAHIFEPFFTTKEVGKGTGLGLATVYGVVKQSGGCVWVYSEVGIGSTFKVYLQRVDEPVERNDASPIVSTLRRGTETILLVEDEDLLRTLTRSLLEQGGYTVLEARDGREALEIARAHSEPIHLLLTDMVMPGMRGPEVARGLAPIHSESKVIYMSGYTSFTRRVMLDSDATLLQKPFTRDSLLTKLREVLDLQGQTQAR
jgi:PAS domain S-box-containing protein